MHPVFATLCMGWCLDIGKIIFGSDNVGVFIYILLQNLVCAFAFSQVMVLLKKLRTPFIINLSAIIYYALLPIFGAFFQIGTKDVMNCGLFTLFSVQTVYLIMEIYQKTRELKPRFYIFYFVISSLCVLYRKEMIIVCVLISLMSIVICLMRNRQLIWKVLSIPIGTIGVYFFFNIVIIQMVLGATFDGGKTESLSIPLQQIARIVYYEGDDVLDEEEKAILDNCFNYGYEGIAEHYNPYLSDPIKYNVTSTDGLWDVYFSLLKKKPVVCLEATIANSFGYYSIVPALPGSLHGAPTNGTPGSRFEFYINRDPDVQNQVVVISYLPVFENMRIKLQTYANNFRSIPILKLFYSLGFYTWWGVILALYLIKQKHFYKLSVLFLPALIVLVCIASPVNDCLRYYISVISVMPLLVGWVTASISKKE